ncbi:SDR family oxidoreductase [Sphingorhabdus sp. Alg239-R122]|uniref:SDR family oxidoreductase n=1 Tax=Sphingorhabdus sp. Alg239-R122 TaxID=2305989 RepID=UPI0013D91348|nr:SDR family oxidoreductase [Sphingorhabdus sp. Alg239-R122]
MKRRFAADGRPGFMRIFLTGGTGLLGGALVGSLLDAGCDLCLLMRGQGSVTDMDGRDRSDEVSRVNGDITLPDFGMETVPDKIDLLVHCAALTDFAAHQADYDAINIAGTVHAIDLARAWGCPLLHVSTAYVCGRQDGVVAEAPLGDQNDFTNGYEASKAAAERIVMAAAGQGLVAAIARPSIIVGRHSDGKISQMDNFYQLFRLMGSDKLGTIPARGDAAFNFVPIDHVVAGLAAMAGDISGFAGEAVHLAAPKPVVASVLIDAIAGYANADPVRLAVKSEFDSSGLTTSQQRMHRRIGPLYFEYFQRTPQFETDILEQKSGIKCPPVDSAALRRMIDYCVATGFLDW